MTILVPGGEGFVGSHYVRAACDAGRRVVILDALSGGATEPLPVPSGAPFAKGDIGARARVRALCREHKVDSVVNFAGKIKVGESVKRPEL